MNSEKQITHYSSNQQILLVGEGDFSFSACLANAFSSATNVVATSLDSEDMVLTKYSSSSTHLYMLRQQGCTILHEVDVNDMNEHPILKDMEFDRVVFNFPHAGHVLFLRETNSEMIRRHQELMRAFFASAKCILSKNGEVHVVHRNDHPYNQWKLEELANEAGLYLVKMEKFRIEDYPGYENKRGSERGSGVFTSKDTFPLGESFTFIFSVRC